jgi:hypothetical protein
VTGHRLVFERSLSRAAREQDLVKGLVDDGTVDMVIASIGADEPRSALAANAGWLFDLGHASEEDAGLHH